MNTSPRWKNQTIAFLAVTTAAGAGLAIHQHRQIAELERSSQVTVINSKPAAAVAKAYLSSPQTPPAATREVLPELDEDPLSPGAEGETRGPRGGDRANWAARMNELMQDPDFVAAWQIQQRARLDGRYAELFKQLNLAPAQLARLQDLLTERQNVWRDVMISARESGLNPRENRDQLREMASQLQAEVDATIKAELGDSTYAAYQQYDSTQNQRNVVNQLNRKLTYSGTQLGEAQSQQLVSIIAANGGQLNDQTINLSRGLLTANQVAALEQLYAEQSAAALVREKMRGGGGR
ncbi:MAG: hypothetical protein ABII82_19280 [Verrucomicrobiota bacterium]